MKSMCTIYISTLSLHDALPISTLLSNLPVYSGGYRIAAFYHLFVLHEVSYHDVYEMLLRKPQECRIHIRSEEHTSELQSRGHLVCRLLLEKKKLINELNIIDSF